MKKHHFVLVTLVLLMVVSGYFAFRPDPKGNIMELENGLSAQTFRIKDECFLFVSTWKKGGLTKIACD